MKRLAFACTLLLLLVVAATVAFAVPLAGDLDVSFNGTGMVSSQIGMSRDYAYAMAVQGDGKIVVVGSANNGSDDDFAIARYNPDGTPDTTFGGTGKVLTNFAGGDDIAAGVALQSDGKIVVVGSAGNGVAADFAVVRYHADGTLDTAFGGTGKVITHFAAGDSSANCVAVQSDGRIVIAGHAHNGTDIDFALVRYHGDISTGVPGTLDTTFGSAGKVVTPFGGDEFITSMALQGNGKILVAGQTNAGGGIDSALARYNADGTLDTAFGSTGKVIANLSADIDAINAVAVQPDGRILAAGVAQNGGIYDFVLARFHGSSATGVPGTLDTAFNGTGKVITRVGTGDDFASGMALQADGRIVVGGSSFNGIKRVFTILRHNANGSLDTTFHGTGTTTADFGTGQEGASSIALQGDGKIVAAGSVSSNSYDFAVARFLGDGPGIAVQAAPGTNVFDGIGAVQFPGALPGANASVTFTIRNSGTANLTGLGITVGGADSAAFAVTANPVAPVVLAGTTTFTVRFQPASLGVKNAVLHIASNVSGSNASYDIALTGAGLTPLENWRQTWFGTVANSGSAADVADPFHTGVSNLLVFGIFGPAQNPALVTAAMRPQPQVIAGNYTITFTEPAGVSGITYGAQWRADLSAGDWVQVTDSGSGNVHVFSVPLGTGLTIFMRLTATNP